MWNLIVLVCTHIVITTMPPHDSLDCKKYVEATTPTLQECRAELKKYHTLQENVTLTCERVKQ